MNKFNIRIDNLAVLSCTDNLLSSGEHTIAKIVQFDKDSTDKEICWAVAYWKLESGYFNLNFIGSRPFDTGNYPLFMELAKYGQDLLNKFFIKD